MNKILWIPPHFKSWFRLNMVVNFRNMQGSHGREKASRQLVVSLFAEYWAARDEMICSYCMVIRTYGGIPCL